MGRYITEIIVYENKEWTPEDLISWGYTHARRHSEITIEIAAHIFYTAFLNLDNELVAAARELMSAADSPCQYVPNYNAEQATSNYNRPSEPAGPVIPPLVLDNIEDANEEWDDTYDYIFDEKLKPSELKKALKGIKYPTRISQRRFFYVTYRIFDVINYFSKEVTPSNFLRWINLHFNCGWIDDNKHRKKFVFALEGSSKNLEDQHPSDWDENTIRGGSGKMHHQLAITLKNTFTETIENGIAVDNSDSFEHLKDRGQFLRDAYSVGDGKFYIPDNAYINNGK